MRIGRPISKVGNNPEEWILAIKQRNYSACFVPFNYEAPQNWIDAFAQAASRENIVIGEVGAWSNPIDPDPEKAKKALLLCQNQLALADQIGARCCVNIAGSRNPNQSTLKKGVMPPISDVRRDFGVKIAASNKATKEPSSFRAL